MQNDLQIDEEIALGNRSIAVAFPTCEVSVDEAGKDKFVPGVDHVRVAARQIDTNSFDFGAIFNQHVGGLELADRFVAGHDVAAFEQHFAPRGVRLRLRGRLHERQSGCSSRNALQE